MQKMRNDNMSDVLKIESWLDETVEQPEAANDDKSRLSYSKKIVAWLDILGVRSKIKNEKKYDAEDIIEIMNSLATYVKNSCDRLYEEDKLDYSQIADGFMIVADISCADEICKIIAEIQWKILVNLKMLSRGAVTVGNVSVYNNDKFIIGPAYVDAYAMESENAIYARTIVSNSFIDETKDSLTVSFLKEDTDKCIYIDYIDYVINNKYKDCLITLKILSQQGVIRELKKNYLSKNQDSKISVLQKYGWTIALLKRNKIDIK